VQLAVPITVAAGLKVRRPVRFMEGLTANMLLGDGVQLTANSVGSDSPGPEETLLAQTASYGPEPSVTVTEPPGTKDGASFTAFAAMQQASTEFPNLRKAAV
jgi:hypothetical protein